MKKLIVAILLIALAGSANAALIINPANPKPLDTIDFTFSPPFAGNIKLEECNNNTGVCYPYQNITLVNGSASVTLTHNDATYITYWTSVNLNNTWIDSDKTRIDLTLEEPEPETPFNYTLLIIGIVVAVVCFAVGYLGFKAYMKRRE